MRRLVTVVARRSRDPERYLPERRGAERPDYARGWESLEDYTLTASGGSCRSRSTAASRAAYAICAETLP